MAVDKLRLATAQEAEAVLSTIERCGQVRSAYNCLLPFVSAEPGCM